MSPTQPVRVVLDADQLAEVRQLGIPLPPGLEAPSPDGTAGSSLAAAGLLAEGQSGPEASGPLADLVEVTATTVAAIRIQVTEGDLAAGGTYLLGTTGAVSLLLAPGGIELSVIDSLQLGVELARAVPPVEPPAERLRLGDLPQEATPRAPESFPWELIDAESELAGPVRATDDERAAADLLRAATTGALLAVVATPGSTTVGQVVWVRTRAGYVGLRPVLRDGRRYVEAVPVEPLDIGAWLAPFVASAVDAASTPSTGGDDEH